MSDPRFYPLLLHRLPHVGAATYHRLVALFGSPEAVFTQSSSQLAAVLDEATLLAIQAFQTQREASVLAQKVLLERVNQ